jgi:hypothetical protein
LARHRIAALRYDNARRWRVEQWRSRSSAGDGAIGELCRPCGNTSLEGCSAVAVPR